MSTEIYRRFHAMKTYGKEPESLDSIIEVFVQDLAEYPTDRILAAIRLHSQRSQEFPTVADIVGLIKRKGRPPLSREAYIAISKKAAEDRTSSDWKYMQDYEDEQKEEHSAFVDDDKTASLLQENNRLRVEVRTLKDEVAKLNSLLHQARLAKGLDKPKPSVEEKVRRTIQAMRSGGAKEEDIEEFARQYGVVAA